MTSVGINRGARVCRELIHASAMAGILLLPFTGCDNSESKTPVIAKSAAKVETASADPNSEAKIRELTAKLRESRIAATTAELKLQESRAKYEQAPSPKPEEVRNAVAASNAELLEKVDELLTRIAKLEEEHAIKPKPEGGPEVMPQDDDPKPPPVTPAQDEAQKESNDALKKLAGGLAAALCVTNPEICPAIAAIAEALGLFGGVPDFELVFTAISKRAAGTPLTPEEASALYRAFERTTSSMPPEAASILWKSFSDGVDGPFTKLVEVETNAWIQAQPPVVKNLIDVIKANARGDAKAIIDEVKQAFPGGQFPSPEAKEQVLVWAAQCGATSEVTKALQAIPAE